MYTCIIILEVMIMMIDLPEVHIRVDFRLTVVKVEMNHVVAHVTEQFSAAECTKHWPGNSKRYS